MNTVYKDSHKLKKYLIIFLAILISGCMTPSKNTMNHTASENKILKIEIEDTSNILIPILKNNTQVAPLPLSDRPN